MKQWRTYDEVMSMMNMLKADNDDFVVAYLKAKKLAKGNDELVAALLDMRDAQMDLYVESKHITAKWLLEKKTFFGRIFSCFG